MSDIHSSLVPRYSPLLKAPRGSRSDEKRARDAADAKQEADCYRKVDTRDEMRCRIYGVRLTATGLTTKAHHHHIIFRSAGGQHITSNVLLLSPKAHDEIHVHGTLRLSGDADARDDRGRFCGVLVERLADGVWTPEGVC